MFKPMDKKNNQKLKLKTLSYLNLCIFSLQVLDEGKVIEFEPPYILLQRSNSFLYKLVEQTGKAEALHLLEIAKAAYNKEQLPVPLPDGNVTIIENLAAETEENSIVNQPNGLQSNATVDSIDRDTIINTKNAEVPSEDSSSMDNKDVKVEIVEESSVEAENKVAEELQDFTDNHDENVETAALLSEDKHEGSDSDSSEGKEVEEKVADKDDKGDAESDTEDTALIAKADSVEKLKKSD